MAYHAVACTTPYILYTVCVHQFTVLCFCMYRDLVVKILAIHHWPHLYTWFKFNASVNFFFQVEMTQNFMLETNLEQTE